MASTTNTTNVLHSSSSRPGRGRREGWLLLRDLLGGALVLAVWLALWTITWAAVAGPLSPVSRADRSPVAAVERA